jgi:hypothetical protein
MCIANDLKASTFDIAPQELAWGYYEAQKLPVHRQNLNRATPFAHARITHHSRARRQARAGGWYLSLSKVTSRYKMCSIQNVNTLGWSRNKLPSKIT